jgi:hypothetical protein
MSPGTEYTLEDLAEEVSEQLGDNNKFTTSAAGLADGTTLISTDLVRRPGQGWIPSLVEITSGSADEEIRPSQDFSVSGTTATLTLFNAFGSQIANSVTFRIHFIDPIWKRQGVIEALRVVSAMFPLHFSEDVLAGELLRNHDFEWWRTPSRLYDWEYIGGTLARSTTAYQGRYSASLTGGSGEVRLRIDLPVELNGVALTFTCWARSAAAGAGQIIRLSQGSTDGDSSALSASDTWTELTATLTPSDAVQPIFARLINTTQTAVLYDRGSLAVASGNSVSWLPISEVLMHLGEVQLGPDASQSPNQTQHFSPHPLPAYLDRARGYGWYDRLFATEAGWGGAQSSSIYLPRNRHMRIIGHARWPVLSALSDTVDLTEEQKQYIGVVGGLYALTKMIGSDHLSGSERWERQAQILEQRRVVLERRARESAPAIAQQIWW